jgi:hypothetical protein
MSFGHTMSKHKISADIAGSLHATLTDLIVEARALNWDFTSWCNVSGYDATNPDARLFFECLLVYARREVRTGLN